jgi:hypothetical protein
MKILTSETQVWIDEVWFPKAIISGLKHLAFIVPDDTFGKASMDIANADVKEKYGINIEYFTNEELAKQWIINQ